MILSQRLGPAAASVQPQLEFDALVNTSVGIHEHCTVAEILDFGREIGFPTPNITEMVYVQVAPRNGKDHGDFIFVCEYQLRTGWGSRSDPTEQSGTVSYYDQDKFIVLISTENFRYLHINRYL
jgi:hypothetical protein